MKVKIFGAGSIGNHLAHAARTMDWEVLICDIDEKALERTKNEIYPARYGKWDSSIRLSTVQEAAKEKFDVVIVGTPPDSHMDLAIEAIQETAPKLVLVEKPMALPSLERCQELYELSKESGTVVCVGYNHVLGRNTLEVERILKEETIGDCLLIEAGFKEYWGGIFKAHPWLAGPHESYLGFSKKGGGASGEHSHAINIWQHFAHVLNLGRINEVFAFMDFVEDSKVAYDRICNINVRTEKGFYGLITQDVVTDPPKKYVRIQGSDGFVEWYVNRDSGGDTVISQFGDETFKENILPKKRPDDFKWEVGHLNEIMEGKIKESPISIERGLDTMMVIAAAHLSYQQKKPVYIDYDKGYRLESIKPL